MCSTLQKIQYWVSLNSSSCKLYHSIGTDGKFWTQFLAISLPLSKWLLWEKLCEEIRLYIPLICNHWRICFLTAAAQHLTDHSILTFEDFRSAISKNESSRKLRRSILHGQLTRSDESSRILRFTAKHGRVAVPVATDTHGYTVTWPMDPTTSTNTFRHEHRRSSSDVITSRNADTADACSKLIQHGTLPGTVQHSTRTQWIHQRSDVWRHGWRVGESARGQASQFGEQEGATTHDQYQHGVLGAARLHSKRSVRHEAVEDQDTALSHQLHRLSDGHFEPRRSDADERRI